MTQFHLTFEQSSDAVFGIDTNGRICFWNKRCEDLLKHASAEVEGRHCHQLLCGTDLQGRQFCRADCPIPQRRHAPPAAPQDFDLVVKRATGEDIMVSVGVYYAPAINDNRARTYFSLRHIDCRRLLMRLNSSECTHAAADDASLERNTLTRREIRILDLASKGLATESIADQLSISIQTVRNHFKNIHAKLGVHSRAEAVGLALRQRLV